MARTASAKHVAVLLFGTFVVLLGAVIAAVGAFRSVHTDPTNKGPYQSAVVNSSAANFRHYIAMISYFPELFDCGKVRSIYGATNSDPELYLGNSTNVILSASFYCWREAGELVWLYALGFVILLIYLALAFIAAFRRSGHSAALGGIGFSVVMISWAILVIVQFQEHSNLPRVLNAFGDCKGFSLTPATTGTTTARSNYYVWSPSSAASTTNSGGSVNPDFGLEVVPNFLSQYAPAGPTGLTTATSIQVNPPVSGTTSINRAFYYERRGGTDLFDETIYATGTANIATNTVAPQTSSGWFVTTSHGNPTVFTTGVTPTPYVIDFARSPARIFGPAPRRAWLCNSDWGYISGFRVTQNLIYGGIATILLGALFVLTAYGYLAHPILGVVKAADVPLQRASNLAADLDDDYTYTYDYSYDDY